MKTHATCAMVSPTLFIMHQSWDFMASNKCCKREENMNDQQKWHLKNENITFTPAFLIKPSLPSAFLLFL